MLIMALRSDNVSNVPAWEVAFREFMERALLVRPRTKEFLIGYPALVLYWYTVRKDYIPGCREALRIVSVLAFSSAVNTFCHFHTLLSLSVIRIQRLVAGDTAWSDRSGDTELCDHAAA